MVTDVAVAMEEGESFNVFSGRNNDDDGAVANFCIWLLLSELVLLPFYYLNCVHSGVFGHWRDQIKATPTKNTRNSFV